MKIKCEMTNKTNSVFIIVIKILKYLLASASRVTPRQNIYEHYRYNMFKDNATD